MFLFLIFELGGGKQHYLEEKEFEGIMGGEKSVSKNAVFHNHLCGKKMISCLLSSLQTSQLVFTEY